MKLNIFKNSAKSDAGRILKVDRNALDSAFKQSHAEIESLRQYDRGEKEITPRDLRSLVRSI